MNALIDEFIKYSRVRKSKHTIQAYKTDLLQFQEFCDKDITTTAAIDISNFLGSLNELGFTKKTLARKLSAISSFCRYLKMTKVMENNPAELVESIKPSKSIPSYLKIEEMKRLREGHKRDLLLECLFEFLLTTGLRESELCSLNKTDIDYERKELRVLGKGNKVRIVMVPDFTLNLLNVYLNDRHDLGEALFTNRGRRLTPNMVYYRIRCLGEKVGIKMYPHLLRHTFATYLLDGGSTLTEVKELLGHENVSTTSIYTHTTAEERGRYDRAIQKIIPKMG